MKANRVVRRTLSVLSVLVLAAVLLPLSPAWANSNGASDLVAPYGHFDMAAGSAPGPLTTHYLISNTADDVIFGPQSATVNVKCFNDTIQRVGNPAGTDITLGANEMQVWSPVTLGLTSDPLYHGLGFCYFAVTSGGNIAVTFLVGVSEGGNLITTNNSVAIMSDTAQSQVIESPTSFPFTDTSEASIPYWTEEGSWQTFILALDPTNTGTDMDMTVYDIFGNILGTWTAPGSPGLAPRDLDFTRMADAIPATAGGFGHAEIDSPDRGFMGWIVGINFTSFQAFMYQIPLDKGDIESTSDLGSVGSDRP